MIRLHMVHSNCCGVLLISRRRLTEHITRPLGNLFLSIRKKGNFLERPVMFGEES